MCFMNMYPTPGTQAWSPSSRIPVCQCPCCCSQVIKIWTTGHGTARPQRAAHLTSCGSRSKTPLNTHSRVLRGTAQWCSPAGVCSAAMSDALSGTSARSSGGAGGAGRVAAQTSGVDTPTNSCCLPPNCKHVARGFFASSYIP